MGNASSADRSMRARLHMERRNNVTWNEFLIAVKDMNKTCMTMKEPSGDYLCFALAKNAMETVFWKQNVKILCFKVNFFDKKIVSCKKLSFEEFMNAYNLKKSIPTTPQLRETSTLADMTTSTMILGETADVDGVCVICMENPNQVLEKFKTCLCSIAIRTKPMTTCGGRQQKLETLEIHEQLREIVHPCLVLLKCLHSFCMVCIAQEMEFRPQFCCPLCKTPIEKPIEDSWEVPDIPHSTEVAQYLSEISNA